MELSKDLDGRDHTREGMLLKIHHPLILDHVQKGSVINETSISKATEDCFNHCCSTFA
jgi:hypothetical protein